MKKYISLFRMRLIAGLQYRAAAIAGISTQFAWGFLNILLYKAFYNASPESFPMGFQELSDYIWLRQAFLAMFMIWFDKEISSMIESGSIAYELTRPTDLYFFWLTRSISSRLSRAALRCAPIILVAVLLPKPYCLSLPSSPLNFLMFVLSMVLALICTNVYMMIAYVMCMYTVNSIGVRAVMVNIGEFFSGGTIPLPFLPEKMRAVIEYSPFGAMQNLPFRIYSGNISGGEMWKFFTLQLFWCVVLLIAGKIYMDQSIKKIVIQGG